MELFLPVLLGTVRDGNRTENVALHVQRRIEARKDLTSRLVDPADLPFENLREREWEMELQDQAVESFVERMGDADGFVIVTPEYNHSIPGALKNLLDHVYDEWNRKPFAIVTTGGSWGGVRAAEALRPIVSGLGAVTVPRSVQVPKPGDTFGPTGPKGGKKSAAPWDRRIDAMLDELVWYAEALRGARDAGVPNED